MLENVGSCKVPVYGERINCAPARPMGDDSEGVEEEPRVWLWCGACEAVQWSPKERTFRESKSK
jgi:hypothetical protein